MPGKLQVSFMGVGGSNPKSDHVFSRGVVQEENQIKYFPRFLGNNDLVALAGDIDFRFPSDLSCRLDGHRQGITEDDGNLHVQHPLRNVSPKHQQIYKALLHLTEVTDHRTHPL